MIAENYDFAREAANSIYAVSADEAIKLQCEARERYERDWASSYESGHRHWYRVLLTKYEHQFVSMRKKICY